MVRAETVTSTHVYTYSGDGLLLAQSIAGAESSFAWDLALDLPQVLATSSGVKSLYGLGRIGVLAGGEWYYPQPDALGSMRQWADAAGAVASLQGYSPYGVPLVPVGPSLAPWGYTGEWQDPSGLVYQRARWYDPRLGRFTQVDPWPGDLRSAATRHPYLYGFANPARYVDPSGRQGSGLPEGAAVVLWLAGMQAGYQAEYDRQVEELRRAGEQVYLNPLALMPIDAGRWRGDATAHMMQPLYVAPPKSIDYTACYRVGLETANVAVAAYVGGLFLKDCAGAGLQALALKLFGSELLQRYPQLERWVPRIWSTGRVLQFGEEVLETIRARQEASDPDALPKAGDAAYAGQLPEKGWKLAPEGQGAHLFEKANAGGRPDLSQLAEPGTPTYYPYGSPRNAGEAHTRIHSATRETGIQLQGGNPSMSNSEILDAYSAAYADPSLAGIKGELRTRGGEIVLGTDVTVGEAWQLLLEWAGLAEGSARVGGNLP